MFYADNTFLIGETSNINELETLLNHEIEKARQWMVANKMTNNPAKSNALVVSPKLILTWSKK